MDSEGEGAGVADSAEHENAWYTQAQDVLQHYAIGTDDLERVTQGLVNLTVKVSTAGGERYILQRLHPVFDASVNHNIDLVTNHLAHKGMPTPRLVRTVSDGLELEIDDQIWRLLSFVDGETVDRVGDSRTAREAGSLLARFHRAMLDFEGELKIARPPVHDIERHLERLKLVLEQGAQRPLYDDVHRLAQQVQALVDDGPEYPTHEPRLVHGDPKISNIMFDPSNGAALCMIDLDTLTCIPLALELGDAFRSWCNPRGEDHVDAIFDIDLFEAGFTAYASNARDFLTPEEAAAIVPATLEIHLELAARFLADAVEECYFAWDPERYASQGEHNLARARGQLSAARSLTSQMQTAERLVSQNMH